MKKTLCLGVALLTSACSIMSNIGAQDVRILRADGTHVILFDENGNISTVAAKNAATKYCTYQGKTAEFESQGGYPLDCVSNQLKYCVTYVCQ